MTTAPRGSFWTVVGTFVLIGPYVGGLIIAVAMLFSGFGSLGSIGIWDLVSLPLMGLMGYPFGALPAALTGALCAATSGHIRSKFLWVVISVAVGWAFATLAFAGIPDSWLYFGPLGAAGAFVSAMVALRVRPRWAN